MIVNIHPGGFFHGSPDPHCYGSPEFIMHRDIVYVCVAYRLHILGKLFIFRTIEYSITEIWNYTGHLNLGIEECSGNQSLKDITLSLKWIKDNIHAFGGDPNNVTILGSSGGAATLHYLMLSPPAKGTLHDW